MYVMAAVSAKPKRCLDNFGGGMCFAFFAAIHTPPCFSFLVLSLALRHPSSARCGEETLGNLAPRCSQYKHSTDVVSRI